MSDIRFSGNDVHVLGGVLKVTCPDLDLDNAGRRRAGGTRRRALVHDLNDGLTLNFNQDYPGGVTINGVERLHGTELRCTHHTLHLNNFARLGSVPAGTTGRPRKTRRRALVHDTTDGLTVNFNRDYPGGVTIRGVVKMPETLLVADLNVLQLIKALRSQVADLQARVQALESEA